MSVTIITAAAAAEDIKASLGDFTALDAQTNANRRLRLLNQQAWFVDDVLEQLDQSDALPYRFFQQGAGDAADGHGPMSADECRVMLTALRKAKGDGSLREAIRVLLSPQESEDDIPDFIELIDEVAEVLECGVDEDGLLSR